MQFGMQMVASTHGNRFITHSLCFLIRLFFSFASSWSTNFCPTLLLNRFTLSTLHFQLIFRFLLLNILLLVRLAQHWSRCWWCRSASARTTSVRLATIALRWQFIRRSALRCTRSFSRFVCWPLWSTCSAADPSPDGDERCSVSRPLETCANWCTYRSNRRRPISNESIFDACTDFECFRCSGSSWGTPTFSALFTKFRMRSKSWSWTCLDIPAKYGISRWPTHIWWWTVSFSSGTHANFSIRPFPRQIVKKKTTKTMMMMIMIMIIIDCIKTLYWSNQTP